VQNSEADSCQPQVHEVHHTQTVWDFSMGGYWTKSVCYCDIL